MNTNVKRLVVAGVAAMLVVGCSASVEDESDAEESASAESEVRTCSASSILSGAGACASAAVSCRLSKGAGRTAQVVCASSAAQCAGSMYSLCEAQCGGICSKDANLRPGRFRCDSRPGICLERDPDVKGNAAYFSSCRYYSSVGACKSACAGAGGSCVTGLRDGTEIVLR